MFLDSGAIPLQIEGAWYPKSCAPHLFTSCAPSGSYALKTSPVGLVMVA